MTSDVLDILDLDEAGPRKSLLDTKALLNRTEKVSYLCASNVCVEEKC